MNGARPVPGRSSFAAPATRRTFGESPNMPCLLRPGTGRAPAVFMKDALYANTTSVYRVCQRRRCGAVDENGGGGCAGGPAAGQAGDCDLFLLAFSPAQNVD